MENKTFSFLRIILKCQYCLENLVSFALYILGNRSQENPLKCRNCFWEVAVNLKRVLKKDKWNLEHSNYEIENKTFEKVDIF